jgi:hypothetical protein
MHSKGGRISILAIIAAVVAATAMTVAALLALQPTPAQANSHTVTVKGCTGKDVNLKREEKRMLNRHNKARSDRGLTARFTVGELVNGIRHARSSPEQ